MLTVHYQSLMFGSFSLRSCIDGLYHCTRYIHILMHVLAIFEITILTTRPVLGMAIANRTVLLEFSQRVT